MAYIDGLARFARRSLPVLLCALAAHAAVYGSLVPSDSMHGYMGIYETVVGVLSAVTLAVFAASVAALTTGRDGPLRFLGGRPDDVGSSVHRSASLAGAALAVLVVQESLERSLASNSIEPASAGVGTWLLALVAVSVVAAAFVLLERSCGGLIRALLAGRVALPRAPVSPPAPHSARRHGRRRNSLAEFRGLRAPPALAV